VKLYLLPFLLLLVLSCDRTQLVLPKVADCLVARNQTMAVALRRLHDNPMLCSVVGEFNAGLSADFGACIASAGDSQCTYCEMSLYPKECTQACLQTNALIREARKTNKLLTSLFD